MYSDDCTFLKDVFYRLESFNAFFSFTTSSKSSVTPLPIFSWFGAQSRMSYFGSRPFQLIKFSSFVHPFADSDRTIICSVISNLISATLLPPNENERQSIFSFYYIFFCLLLGDILYLLFLSLLCQGLIY